MMTIIARKPRSTDAEFVLVERLYDRLTPFVVATVTTDSLAHDEWFWGHYFSTFDAAYAFFNGAS